MAATFLEESGWAVSVLDDGLVSVAGAFVLPQLRAKLSVNALVIVASLTYAAALAVVVLSRNLALTVLLLLPGRSRRPVTDHLASRTHFR